MSIQKRLLTFFITFALMGAATCVAEDIHVDHLSINPAQFGTENSPDKTVEKALKRARDSDDSSHTLDIRKGLYIEEVTFDEPMVVDVWEDGEVEIRSCEYCLGGIGSQCGEEDPWIVEKFMTTFLKTFDWFHPNEFNNAVGWLIAEEKSTCVNGTCLINSGSWAHDECCFENPDGYWCGKVDLFVAGLWTPCYAHWRKALERTSQHLWWKRTVDFLKPNCSGKVVFSEYCAKKGTLVHVEDKNYCCSQSIWNPANSDIPGLAAAYGNPTPPDDILDDVRVCK